MATFLDVGLLQTFDVIFPFLIVFAILFAVLQKTSIIGKNPGINAMIAIAGAFMAVLSDTIVQVLNFSIPWFVVVIIFLVLLVLIFQTAGAQEADIAKAVKDKTVYWTLIGIVALIVIAAFSNVLGQQLTERSGTTTTIVNGETVVSSDNFEDNIYGILFHPKILGVMILFAVAIFAVLLLSGSPSE